ncbi:MAG: ATP synthase F1 subunit delta [Elusimicrobiaceae bacterium]|jgi:F-type H+-transporting ATPase subunit delta|uniref:ATP synthase subunit delta n=1 Tax=Candidatus Avelusimicrobium gallicola TaxID=2562704 RepID=A0A928HIG3_9BACT|nr:ATP synthase F1 subunit delta [Elusimicrobium sp.]MBQ9971135.1 ATP synthase F1 subunit delta [Elusimicrobiaceae bacterium]
MNSSDRIAVQRYAAAYNQLSQNDQEAVLHTEQLKAAAEALASVKSVMDNPRISLLQKKEMVREALSSVSVQTASFVEVLIDAKRYALLPEIVKTVETFLDERLGIVRARVLSARELSAEQKQQTQDALSARYGGKIEIVFDTDPALLGGLKIWCRGEMIDGSLQGRLAKLQEELIK